MVWGSRDDDSESGWCRRFFSISVAHAATLHHTTKVCGAVFFCILLQGYVISWDLVPMLTRLSQVFELGFGLACVSNNMIFDRNNQPVRVPDTYCFEPASVAILIFIPCACGPFHSCAATIPGCFWMIASHHVLCASALSGLHCHGSLVTTQFHATNLDVGMISASRCVPSGSYWFPSWLLLCRIGWHGWWRHAVIIDTVFNECRWGSWLITATVVSGLVLRNDSSSCFCYFILITYELVLADLLAVLTHGYR